MLLDISLRERERERERERGSASSVWSIVRRSVCVYHYVIISIIITPEI